MRLEAKTEKNLVDSIVSHYPTVIAIYLFGSYYSGYATTESDLDVALLLPKAIDAVACWELSRTLAYDLGVDVDLVQLNEASTVFRYVILAESKLLYCADEDQRQFFEMTALSMYFRFEEERKAIVQDRLKGDS